MRALALVALALLAAAQAPASPVPCPAAGCPDLTVDALDGGAPYIHEAEFVPSHCAVVEGLVQPGARTLLRFPMTTANVGAGPLVLGHPADRPEWFEASACHGHHHFAGFADYRLWTLAAYGAWTAERAQAPHVPASTALEARPDLAAGLAAGRKQGFCVMDTRPLAIGLSAGFPSCGYQGLSPGWEDRYDSWLDGQWIDITGVPPGWYVLETETNPERRIAESSYRNNAVGLPLYVG